MSTNNPDLNFLDPRFQAGPTGEPEEARVARLRNRFGSDCEPWDKEFGGLDTSTEKARAAGQKLRDHLAAAGTDPDRPLLFSVTIAGRTVPIQVREENGEWSCVMPCEIEVGTYEYRTLIANSYDSLIGMVNRQLAAGPLIRDLTEAETLELARACVTRKKENLAAVLEAYLRLRIGHGVDESVLSDPRYRSVVDEACLFVFFNSEPSARDSKEFRAFLKSYAAGRPYSLPLVKTAWPLFQKQAAMASLKQQTERPEVTEEQLQAASDEEIGKTLSGIRKQYATAERQRRDLLHN